MSDDPQTPQRDPPGPPPSEAEAYPSAPPAAAGGRQAAHSVPATPLGQMSTCLRCGTQNRPGVAFCRQCGQRLLPAGLAAAVERPGVPVGMTACPRCGTHNRADGSFCASCGAHLRASAPAAETVAARVSGSGPAVLGPVVLLIGAAGITTAWLLPFAFSAGSLFDRSFGASGGYGLAFWQGYAAVGKGLIGDAYFGLAAPAPALVLLLGVLAVAGLLRGTPGRAQRAGLLLAFVWGLGLALGFVAAEVLGGPGGGLLGTLRALSPGGIIFLLAGLVVVIGAATRLARA